MTSLLFFFLFGSPEDARQEKALTRSSAPISGLLLKSVEGSTMYVSCFLKPLSCWWTPGRIPWLGYCEQWVRQWVAAVSGRVQMSLPHADSISCARVSTVMLAVLCLILGGASLLVSAMAVRIHIPTSRFTSFAQGLHLLFHFTNIECGLEPLRKLQHHAIFTPACVRTKITALRSQYDCNTREV